ncbi:MAG: 16S rRNA (adenine(1518)-N(6)/adenine(1519)-N(6))-dimethyltransferase RsmA [Duncaniella sp.]|jgi:16S rRNA (adenine1518-N6/adenine1519-N6)-dimethyltransferase|uniref:16S rRNA (adenine(1518)-N(6)/adenine(1519)-N(6))- dimethyltransferase RsmA n=1 Tax=Duncaniella muricolitica TaxID=2880704 RepID=UPI00244DA3EC|nr:16S rRNA (adenine(1518)-N(6)/adenine(1519)-N(6))-dimethyltransferase RsmA [Duncaniella muricolitica]MCX4369408.1 16S rRNA (adenine(1518)-N(6)/adenine(1519)-N(6))-dimethyltransferase RsmA [Duncaniella sp.]
MKRERNSHTPRPPRIQSAVKPKKALGQHFLTDESVAQRIAATLDPWHGLPVLEVGPGMGVLTKYLLASGHDVKVAEIDTESIQYLRYNFPELSGRILDADFLRLDLAALYPDGSKFCVIGNYPYNISSQIFFHILDYKDRVTACSGMLQREVAQRLAAPEGTKDRGILSVLLQAWYDVRYLFTVDENVFNPPPKVKSGVIIMTRNDVTDLGCDERLFKTVVKTTFGQRRKTIRNSIRGLLPPGAPLPDTPLLTLRPEQLTVAQFIELTNLLTP